MPIVHQKNILFLLQPIPKIDPIFSLIWLGFLVHLSKNSLNSIKGSSNALCVQSVDYLTLEQYVPVSA